MLHQLQLGPSHVTSDHQASLRDRSLLVAHLDAAYNLARWLMRDKTEAEEAVQDAYLRAISHFETYRGGDGRAWLLTIVRNGCFDRMKQQKNASTQNTHFDEALYSSAVQTPNPETAMLLAERSELARELLSELSEEYREILVLREMEQLSYREIADITGIPLGTVMSRLSRARQQIQQALVDSIENRTN